MLNQTWTKEGTFVLKFEKRKQEVYYKDCYMFRDYYENNQVQNRYSLPNGEMFIGPNIKNFTEKGKGSYYYFDGSIYK